MAVSTIELSISDVASTLSSNIQSSALRVPSEMQQTNDFQSIAGQTSASSVSIPSCYDGIIWMRIPLFGPALDVVGDTRQSDVWKHGWRVIHKQDQKLYRYWQPPFPADTR